MLKSIDLGYIMFVILMLLMFAMLGLIISSALGYPLGGERISSQQMFISGLTLLIVGLSFMIRKPTQ